jgi:hypothetical protein
LFSGGVCLQATPSSGRRIRFSALTIVRSARTEDLRVELNRRRAGEDARVSIERA